MQFLNWTPVWFFLFIYLLPLLFLPDISGFCFTVPRATIKQLLLWAGMIQVVAFVILYHFLRILTIQFSQWQAELLPVHCFLNQKRKIPLREFLWFSVLPDNCQCTLHKKHWAVQHQMNRDKWTHMLLHRWYLKYLPAWIQWPFPVAPL